MAMYSWRGLYVETKNVGSNHQDQEKRLIMDFLMNAHIEGATVWTGVNGFGKRGKSTMHIEGIMINMPLIIEVIDTQEKLEPLLPDLRQIIGDDGLVTIQETYVI